MLIHNFPVMKSVRRPSSLIGNVRFLLPPARDHRRFAARDLALVRSRNGRAVGSETSGKAGEGSHETAKQQGEALCPSRPIGSKDPPGQPMAERLGRPFGWRFSTVSLVTEQ